MGVEGRGVVEDGGLVVRIKARRPGSGWKRDKVMPGGPRGWRKRIQSQVFTQDCAWRSEMGQRRVVAKGVGGDYCVFALLRKYSLSWGGTGGGGWWARAYWVVPCMPTHLLAAQQKEGPLYFLRCSFPFRDSARRTAPSISVM